jgi:DNA polymerase V
MFALADVNSFYASCEKGFRPDLRNKPVVVLQQRWLRHRAQSEAKRLGIKMGVPWFQLKTTIPGAGHHVLQQLRALCIAVEQGYVSSGRAGAARGAVQHRRDVSGYPRHRQLHRFEDFGRQLREHVRSGTGLTIGVGMGPTKTLAKSAQWASKEWRQFGGVLALTSAIRRTEKLLSLQPVEEIWGVGRRISKLNTMGITTALQLARANPVFIRKNFSVVLERTVRELNGESCISLEEAPPPKQQIVCSRSFGERVTTYEAMRQAVCQYAERAAEKLRGERQFCRHIAVH